jgi:hypothetical protein
MNLSMNGGDSNHFEGFPASRLHCVLYMITKSEVIEQNQLRFAEFFNIERIVKAGRLHDMFDRVVFCVDGYNDDRREIFQIPEVRRFLKSLAEMWPYFFYADALQTAFLPRMLQCMVPNLTAATDGKQYRVAVKTKEMNDAYKFLLDGFSVICGNDRQMTREIFDARIEAIQRHLQREYIGTGTS